jgi:hypothetical protein
MAAREGEAGSATERVAAGYLNAGEGLAGHARRPGQRHRCAAVTPIPGQGAAVQCRAASAPQARRVGTRPTRRMITRPDAAPSPRRQPGRPGGNADL